MESPNAAPRNSGDEPLCRLLAASMDIYAFLLAEQELTRLLQGLCDRLVIDGLFSAAWLFLTDESMSYAITAESGLGRRMAPLKEKLQQGALPRCGQSAMEAGRCMVFPDCDCAVCGASPQGGRTLAVGLKSGDTVSGFLALEALNDLRFNSEECGLLEKIALAVATTLGRLFGIAERDRNLEALRASENRFKLALQASDAGLWDWNLETGEMYTSDYQQELLDQGDPGDNARSWRTLIHPDDRDLVLARLQEHLAGRNEDYQVEYRIRDKNGGWRWFKDRGRVVDRADNGLPLRMIGTHQDITEEKHKDAELAAAREKLHETVRRERVFLQSVIDGAGDPVMVIDMEYNILLINSAAGKIMDVDPRTAPGGKCYTVFHGTREPLCKERCSCPVDKVRAGKGPVNPLVHPQFHGKEINNTYELDVSPLYGEDGEPTGIIEVARNVEDRLRIERELRKSRSRYFRLAHHDTLTGLPNRLLFQDRLKQAMIKARRKKTRVAVLFLDLDRFKQINDTLGHDVGDELLVEVARRLLHLVRKSDTVARLGGDEFVIILDDITNAADAATVGRKILAAMEQPVVAGGRELFISTSIGIAFFPDDADDMEGVLKCADTALYKAKDNGRAGFRFYEAAMNSRAHTLLRLETALRKARSDQRFVIHYQGMFDPLDGRLRAMEALLRWHHPELGMMLPYDFIALAEELGLMVSIGEWVVETVVRRLASWRKEDLHPVPTAVNLSARQLLDSDFARFTAKILKKYRLPPSFIEYEITEEALMRNLKPCRRQLEELRAMGIRITLDDFGAGSSSLASLNKLPIDRLKIDRSFIKDVTGNENSAMITRAVIGLGRNLGLEVAAKGVERPGEADFCRDCGCSMVQGFLFGRPLPAGDSADLLPAARTLRKDRQQQTYADRN